MSQQSQTRLESFFFSWGNSSDQWIAFTAYVYQFVPDHLVSDGIAVSGSVRPTGSNHGASAAHVLVNVEIMQP